MVAQVQVPHLAAHSPASRWRDTWEHSAESAGACRWVGEAEREGCHGCHWDSFCWRSYFLGLSDHDAEMVLSAFVMLFAAVSLTIVLLSVAAGAEGGH